MKKFRLIDLLWLELKSLVTNPVINLTMFGGVVFYSFLYPLPYAQQVVQELPIAVVNQDNSQVSYKLERMLDATSQVKVIQRVKNIKEAEQLVLAQEAGGFVVIPRDFYKDLLLGKSPTLSYAGDASYFLVYGGIVEGLATASGTLAAEVKVSRLLLDGTPLGSAAEQYTAIKANMKPTFNPRMGYVDYVVPAVFVLILQQTLVMAAGLMNATQKSLPPSEQYYWLKLTPLQNMALRCTVLGALYYLLALYYFGFSFSFYGIATLANHVDVIALLLPFLLASTCLGITLGNWLPRRELVTVIVLLSSMPLIFTAGFIWPVEMIPQPINQLAALFPSTPAIKGFLAINQMGAEWDQISTHYYQLWLQNLGWAVVAWVSYRFVQPHKNGTQ